MAFVAADAAPDGTVCPIDRFGGAYGGVRLPTWLPRPVRSRLEMKMTRASALVRGVGREGLEPPTPCASCRCSSQLS